MSLRLTVSRRQLGHAEGTGKLSIDEVTGDQLVATPATIIAVERALVNSLRSADPATFDTQLRT